MARAERTPVLDRRQGWSFGDDSDTQCQPGQRPRGGDEMRIGQVFEQQMPRSGVRGVDGLNDQWRVIFKWIDGEPHEVRIVDYH